MRLTTVVAVAVAAAVAAPVVARSSRTTRPASTPMRSNFDLATNAPGKVGEVVNTIIAATDGGDDPANWILEQVIAKMPTAP